MTRAPGSRPPAPGSQARFQIGPPELFHKAPGQGQRLWEAQGGQAGAPGLMKAKGVLTGSLSHTRCCAGHDSIISQQSLL